MGLGPKGGGYRGARLACITRTNSAPPTRATGNARAYAHSLRAESKRATGEGVFMSVLSSVRSPLGEQG